jgi:hypothetical protein
MVVGGVHLYAQIVGIVYFARYAHLIAALIHHQTSHSSLAHVAHNQS